MAFAVEFIRFERGRAEGIVVERFGPYSTQKEAQAQAVAAFADVEEAWPCMVGYRLVAASDA